MITAKPEEARKAKIRAITLDILFQKVKVTFEPFNFNHLKIGVAEHLDEGGGKQENRGLYSGSYASEAKLTNSDTEILMEVFWDLVVEKVFTIGSDADNPAYPNFRLHSSVRKKDRKDVA